MANYTVHLSDAAAQLEKLRVRWNQSYESYPIKGKTVDVTVPDGVDFVLQCEPLDRAHPVRQIFLRDGRPKAQPPGSEPYFRLTVPGTEKPAGPRNEPQLPPNELRDELGLPPQLVKTLNEEHGITTIEQLRKVAAKGPLQDLKFIGESSEKQIREKLEAHQAEQ